MEKVLLIAQIATTFSLTGFIWLVQIVHYPLFSFAGEEKYRLFHLAHMNRITFVVAPLMVAEAISGALIIFYPPENADPRFLLIGAALIMAIWLSTFLLQVPLHEKLAQGFDADVHRALVNTNWIRTIGWSLRSALILWLAWQALK